MKIKKILILLLSVFTLLCVSCRKAEAVQKVIITDYKGETTEITSYEVEDLIYGVNSKTNKVYHYLDIENTDNYYFTRMNLTYNVKIKLEDKKTQTYTILLVASVSKMGDTMYYFDGYTPVTIQNNLNVKKFDLSSLDLIYHTSITDKVEIIY